MRPALAVALLALAQGADVASTYYGSTHGNVELNPLVAQLGPVEFGLLKLAVVVYAALALAVAPALRRPASWLVACMALVTFTIAAHNLALTIT